MPHSLISLLLAFSLIPTGAFPATAEYKVKAAHVFNLTKFFEWPKNESASRFTICIYGKDPFQEYLEDVVRGKLTHGLPVVIRHLGQQHGNWDECQILFISGTTPARIDSVLAGVEGRSVLTIGESDSFVERGGMIGLVIDQDRIRFDVNLLEIHAAHLLVSSQLVALGRRVKK